MIKQQGTTIWRRILVSIAVIGAFSSTLLLTLNIQRDQNNSTNKRQRQLHQEGDYSSYSCEHLNVYRQHNHSSSHVCSYAQTCNDGDGVFAPFVFCDETKSPTMLGIMLSPIILLVVVVLFRMVGSSAEDYFSPALQMISFEFGLPPRFAGVTLLALGNGAPDIAATVNAIRDDKQIGYQLGLGELTGSGMFISTVITASIVLVANSNGSLVHCGHQLIRDVVMLFFTNLLIYTQFNSQKVINMTSILVWFSVYLSYILIVLIADLCHKYYNGAQSSSKKEASLKEDDNQKENGDSKQIRNGKEDIDNSLVPNEKTNLVTRTFKRIPSSGSLAESLAEKAEHFFIGTLSNYDDPLHISPLPGGKGVVDIGQQQQQQQQISPTAASSGWPAAPDLHGGGVEPFIVVHPHHGGVLDLSERRRRRVRDYQQRQLPSHIVSEERSESSSRNAETAATSWSDAYAKNCDDMIEHWADVWNDIYHNEENNLIVKFLLTCELPFTVLRQITTPITSEEYYCRPLLAMSTMLSPFWLRFYFDKQFDINIFDGDLLIYMCIMELFFIVLGLCIVRYAPRYGPLPLVLAVCLGLYGFVVAATWIDYIADTLVDLLSFTGILCNIPAPLMGATVLAVGNSIGDLLANLAVARKGLCDMAITACFAGPVFAQLIGLALGFTALTNITGDRHMSVTLTPALQSGFLFSMGNCIATIFFGTVIGKGIIRKEYGYIALFIYVSYAISAFLLAKY